VIGEEWQTNTLMYTSASLSNCLALFLLQVNYLHHHSFLQEAQQPTPPVNPFKATLAWLSLRLTPWQPQRPPNPNPNV
jgi:hypothetical protein